MEEQEFPLPLKLYAEKSVFSKHAKVDLVLGDDETLVELKLKPDYPGVSKPVVFNTKKEAAGSGSIESDLEKVEEYASKGKSAHFVMIDEDGCHVRRIGGEKWKAIYVNLNGPKKLCHYLHVRRNCRYLDSHAREFQGLFLCACNFETSLTKVHLELNWSATYSGDFHCSHDDWLLMAIASSSHD